MLKKIRKVKKITINEWYRKKFPIRYKVDIAHKGDGQLTLEMAEYICESICGKRGTLTLPKGLKLQIIQIGRGYSIIMG